MRFKRFLILLVSLAVYAGHAQSIEEKKQALLGGSDSTDQVSDNRTRLLDSQSQLEKIYQQAAQLRQMQAGPEQYAPLYEQAKALHTQWQVEARQLIQGSTSGESEAIWHLPDATVKQLVIDFGGSDAIYLIPEELAQRKVAVVSSLSLPRQSWPAMLELMLAEMGIGVRQVNPFCRELFTAGLAEGFERITDQREELWLLPDQQRVCFVVSAGAVDIKQFARALSRLVDPASTQIKPIGSQLALIAPALRVRQLMQIYDFMARTEQAKAYRIVSLSRLSAEDLQKMLAVIFAQSSEGATINKGDLDAIGLQVFPIQYDQRAALFVSGSENEVKRAVDLIAELESQIEQNSGKRLFWYSAKHASIEDLAKVISKVYRLLVQTGTSSEEAAGGTAPAAAPENFNLSSENIAPLVVSASGMNNGSLNGSSSGVQRDGQIVVDAKSGAFIMVVEPSILPKIKELLARLDTPKKMVRVDFLLFEKKLTDQTQFGLERLKIGSAASRTNSTGMGYGYTGDALSNPSSMAGGIMHFFGSSKGKHGVPSFDVAYNFLLSQESIQINANPSVITLNGTPSFVNIVDEISLNTGPVQSQDGQGSVVMKDAFTRAQYGITLKVTPTVHQGDQSDQRTVTLETDIIFDTPSSLSDPRPTVSRRQIKNLVKVGDGQTVILGGLRQKQIDDTQTGLPFLGDLPGFGKLFSYSSSKDITKEMFIFITPHVIDDSEEDYQKLRMLEMKRRPGDLNEFLVAYEQSQEQKQRNVFAKSLEVILGKDRSNNSSATSIQRGGYDGRN